MKIAKSLPGVSTRFDFLSINLILNFDYFPVLSTPSVYYSIFMPTYSHAVKLQRNICFTVLMIEILIDSTIVMFSTLSLLAMELRGCTQCILWITCEQNLQPLSYMVKNYLNSLKKL
jgi:hypothetical protein